ncbi:MAG: diguanylate cyclase [Xanthomonadaceae bacterium]|nr:diguanylate cyclase [Xanthomonadaceae bacterium]
MTAIEQLRLNGGLPSPKGVALAIMRICRRDDASLDEIARVVQTDPVTSSRLLHMANAAHSGGRPVASIPDAIMRLGLEAVRQLAMGFSLVDQYREGACKGFDYTAFWSHSLLMAVAMQELGKLTRVASPDELFACGLMARIGYLALATLYPDDYSRLLQVRSDNMLALEREHLHVDHNQLTGLLLADCGIPKALAEPVQWHEAPDASGFVDGSRPHKLVHLFYQARRLADLASATADDRAGTVSELMLLGGKLGLDAGQTGELVDQILARWRDWSSLLQVPAATLPPFADLVSGAAGAGGGDPLSAMPRVLWVAHDPAMRALLAKTLDDLFGAQVPSAQSGEQGLAMALRAMPQIVVVDARLPAMDGWALCRALRATAWGQSIYLLVLNGADATAAQQTLDCHANDYLTAPVLAGMLQIRLTAAMQYVKLLNQWEQDRAQLKQFSAELAISNRKLERFALTDLLTGLQNRRAGMDSLSQAWGASIRSGAPMTVMMIDIDSFKDVNDTWGHATGDQVLIDVAAVIRASARKEDSVCRMGGEEFFVLCRDADVEATLHAAERLREKVASLKIRVENAQITVTISIGLAAREADMTDPGVLVNAADKALYASKREGRNRTSLFRHGEVLPG